MKRQFDPAVLEWMDTAQEPDHALGGTLENLRILNARFGAHRFAREKIVPLLRQNPSLRWLDLACGMADIPAHAIREAGVETTVEYLGVDASPATLHFARTHCAGLRARFIAANALDFTPDFPPDLVTCFLALHHFSEADAVQVLTRMHQTGARILIAADLLRSVPATIGIDFLTAVWMRQPETRNDARLSIRRAFSFEEFGELARKAGWRDFEHARFPWFRQAVSLGLPAPSPKICPRP